MGKLHNEATTLNGKAAFYACIFEDLKRAAFNCGWALGLHGSLANDMDIMTMPWTDEAKPVEEMIEALSGCFADSIWKDHHIKPYHDKPNNRVVYTMCIFKDWYLDINVIATDEKQIAKKPIRETVARGSITYTVVRCPTCKDSDISFGDIYIFNYCSECGQKIDWSE